jgi:M6 family metalloprotease-like protein
MKPYRLTSGIIHRVALSRFGLGRMTMPIVAFGLALWTAIPAGAVPANPEGREVVQPDGSKFVLHVRGDEFLTWKETAEGYAVEKDSADGFWKYARPVKDKAEFRGMPNARVGQSDPDKLGLRKHDRPERAAIEASVKDRRKALGLDPAESAAPSDEQSLEEEPPQEPPQRVPVDGNVSVKQVVILACFSNHWDAVNGTVLSAYGRVSVGEYSNLFNEVGHTTDGAVGSVKDYYKEVSYGKLTLDSVVTKWVLLPSNSVYYGEGVHGGRPGILAAHAVEAADAAGVDFSQFDSDGDGWVDALCVIHSGYGEESTGDSNDVWSVKGSMPSVIAKDGVNMRPYHSEPAFRGSSGTGISRIGVIAHEMGHFFGLPDLYDYSPNTKGLGYWCEMAGGTWNGGGARPAHFSAWCKVFLGFAETIPIHSKEDILLPRVEDRPVVGILRDGTSNDEYFLIENRARVGFDNDANIHPGLVIYHVDDKSRNNDLETWTHPLVKIEEADGNDSLGSKTASSQAGDVWTSTSGLSGGFRDQTGSSSANAMLYQSNPTTNILYSYNRTNDAAFYTYSRLSNFSATGSNMTFSAQTLKTDAPAQNALAVTNFTVAWAAASEATKYEIQEGSNTTLTSLSDGAEDQDTACNNWHFGGGVKIVATNASYAGSSCFQMWGRVSVHILALRQPFKVTTATTISFQLMSHISSGNGYLKCQVSNDDGATWKTLGMYNGKIDPWSLRSYDYAAMSAQGISAGDTCRLRFVADIENISGWSAFPYYGYALDDISITGTEITGYGGWTTLDNNVTSTSFTISGKPAGTCAYRIQAYANGEWQGYGAVGETTVGANHSPSFISDTLSSDDATVGSAYSGTVGALAADSDVNDILTFSKLSGPAWAAVSANGTISGMPLPGDIGPNALTVRVTDLSGAYDEAQVNIFVGLPDSALDTGLVAYLPFDSDYKDYSGQGNDPALSNSNTRAAGCLGANAYVLNSTGYLSFGQMADLHFADTVAGHTTSFSISFWAKMPSGSYSGQPAFIANKDDWGSTSSTGWGLASGPGTSTQGYFQMNFDENSANVRNYDSTNTALINGWHHYLVVFRRDAPRTAYTYIDGQQVNSVALYSSGSGIDNASLPVNIGRDGSGSGMLGSWNGALMDDFAFWRRTVTAAEAASIYAAGTKGISMAYAQAGPIVTNLTADFELAYGGATNLSVEVLSGETPAYQWRLGGVDVAGATNSTLSITNTRQDSPLIYDVVVANSYGETTSQPVVVTLAHGIPVAGAVTVHRQTNAVLKVTDATLLANSSDPEGSALSIVWVSPASTNGGSVVLSGHWIIYTAVPGYNSTDAFTFRVQNVYGNTADGTATVQMDTSGNQGSDLNIAGLVITASNSVMRIVGIPGRNFDVQHATRLVAPDWTTVGNATIGSLGYVWFTNAPLPEGTTHFFRTIEPE